MFFGFFGFGFEILGLLLGLDFRSWGLGIGFRVVDGSKYCIKQGKPTRATREKRGSSTCEK